MGCWWGQEEKLQGIYLIAPIQELVSARWVYSDGYSFIHYSIIPRFCPEMKFWNSFDQ